MSQRAIGVVISVAIVVVASVAIAGSGNGKGHCKGNGIGHGHHDDDCDEGTPTPTPIVTTTPPSTPSPTSTSTATPVPTPTAVVTPSPQSGLVWKDATGSTIDRIFAGLPDLHGYVSTQLYYLDDNGHFWLVDPNRATLRSISSATTGYSTSDCSGDAHVSFGVLPRFPVMVRANGLYAVRPDDAASSAVPYCSTKDFTTGTCNPQPTCPVAPDAVVVIADPSIAPPAVPWVAPLHPEL